MVVLIFFFGYSIYRSWVSKRSGLAGVGLVVCFTFLSSLRQIKFAILVKCILFPVYFLTNFKIDLCMF